MLKNIAYPRTLLNSYTYCKTQTRSSRLADSSHFSIEHLSQRETQVKYKPTNVKTTSSWATPEIDTINLLDLCSSNKFLFTTFKESGYDSPLISHFSSCEQFKRPFRDPEYTDILISRHVTSPTTYLDTTTQYHFHLNGGKAFFHRILDIDPVFWSQILQACRKTDFVRIRELHLAADTEQELMPYVSKNIQKGHYETSGLKCFGYYYLAGEKKRTTVGKRSSYFKTFQDKELKIETLYCGNIKNIPISIVIYDKKAEQLERKNAYSNSQTRIELRLSNVGARPHILALMESILASYYQPNGAGFRTRVFVDGVTSHLRFTNHFNKAEDEDLAPWWRSNVISPLYHAGLEMFPGDFSEYLNGRNPLQLPSKIPANESTKSKRGRRQGSRDSVQRKQRSDAGKPRGPRKTPK